MAGKMDSSVFAQESWVPMFDEVAVPVRTPAGFQASDPCDSPETGRRAEPGLLRRMLDELDYGLMLVGTCQALTATPHRCGSPQQLAQPGRAGPRRMPAMTR